MSRAGSEVLDFLNSIEGAGYGGMASFEIARAHVQDMLDNDVLERAEAAFESIRLTLVNRLEEPERSAFWTAVEARDVIRAVRKSSSKSAPPILTPHHASPSGERLPSSDAAVGGADTRCLLSSHQGNCK